MKTRLATIAAALVGAAFGAGGCITENRASLQTQAICFPTADCTFGATCGAQYIATPTLDKGASADDTLVLFLQIANQLPNNEDRSVGRTNTNDAHIDETVIEYEGAMGGTQASGSSFRVPASGTAVVSASFTLTNAAAGEVLAHLRFRGYYDDGTRFETGDFPIAIDVCATGCAPVACTTAACPAEGQRPLECAE